MNFGEFQSLVSTAQQDMEKTLAEKGVEYAPDRDRLSNFKKIERLTGVAAPMVCIILMSKHYVSICEMAQDPLSFKEDLWDEKLGDIRNYTVLLRALIIDERSVQ